ncbi:toll-like receptor 1 [Rhinatrema bivittatum]|uniref:toll-like receptor 1 n=1 Tax=Rhinatrema bivittatum TaxID=194408 RepID=UPI00112AFF7F|nr:toll-like receptor 1 [Rhinatrema bivittatum]
MMKILESIPPISSAFIILFTSMLVFSNTQLPTNNDFIVKHSKRFLDRVPKNLPSETTMLDLSENNLSLLLSSDFSSLTKLKLLNLSYNLIRELDANIFRFNSKLQHLDLSHNHLKNITCSSLQHIRGLQYLDLSSNKFENIFHCKEFSSFLHLKYLGLSATRIQTSYLKEIEHLGTLHIFLGLEHLSYYEPGSLQVLSTDKLHIVLPVFIQDTFILNDIMNTSRTLEISHFRCNKSCDYLMESLSTISKNSKVSTLIFNNITVTWQDLIQIFKAVWYSSIECLKVHHLMLVGEFPYFVPFNYAKTSLKALSIQHSTSKIFYHRGPPHPSQTYSEMMIENFTFVDNDMIHFICPSKPSIFRFLNLARNKLTDTVFQNCDNLPLLETLILKYNRLEKLSAVSTMTSSKKFLKHLDVSNNKLQYENGEDCHWSETLLTLNLSANRLADTTFGCLPINVKILDLHNNQISHIPKTIMTLTFLEELNLAFNWLTELPDCSHFSSLAVLHVENNSLHSPSSHSLQICQKVRVIKAGNNPFRCDCDLKDFINWGKQSAGDVIEWPESYMCQYPEDVKGTLLKDVLLSEVSCNTAVLLGIILGTLAGIMLCISCLCLYFDLPWYFKMMWNWTQTKRRIRNTNPKDIQKNLVYHAFISYSQQDSIWVKSYLIPNLEKGDGSVQICQHERDFVPGRSIIENIINCIERSYKSIFVLSPNFIQSEWCHYELYFAHHRLFTESSDNLILVLLEPIPQYLIPSKYYKLKALMAKRTYLEWPKEKRKRGLFWANLRESINVHLPKPNQETVKVFNINQENDSEPNTCSLNLIENTTYSAVL